MNPQARELNRILKLETPALFGMLSEKGRAIYFPKEGIVNQSNGAKGKRINATIGIAVEDDGTPVRLRCIADRIQIAPQDAFPYTSNYGKPELRKAWQEEIRVKNPSLRREISLPVVTNALTHGLSMAGYLFADGGNRIFLPDLYWENYELIFENAYGARLVPFNTFNNGGMDLAAFAKALSGRKGKKIVLLSMPNNPTGYTPTESEAGAIAGLILKRAEKGDSIVVFLDDAYFGLVYEPGVYRESLFAKLADLHENVLAVKIDGATKEEYAWGLRVGFVTYGCKGITPAACKALEDKTAGAVRGSISNASHLSQSLLLQAMASPTYAMEKKDKFALLQSRYETVKRVLTENENRYADAFTPLPFNSGYFMCIRLKGGLQGEAVRRKLLDAYDTGVIALGPILRFTFSSVSVKNIPEAFENIYRACKE